MNNSKRNLIFVPEINPTTFVLFYFEGSTNSRSYSVREFPESGRAAITRYADKFSYTAGQVLELARRDGSFCIPAQPHRVDDVAFWCSEILKLNDRYLGDKNAKSSNAVEAAPSEDSATADATNSEPSPPTTNFAETDSREKTCGCGCGMPVNKHDYVWGHKSGSRDNTIPMAAKHLSDNAGLNGGRNHIQLAVQQLLKEIAVFEGEIAKRRQAIEALGNLNTARI